MTTNSEIFKNYFGGCVSGMAAILASHPIDTIKTLYQEGKEIKLNFKSLYRGIRPPLLGIGLEKALVFGTYETMKKKYDNDFICGGVSGAVASFIVTPYERLKILRQTNQNILNKFKVGYLYQGLSSTFYREIPGFAIYFSMFNFLKNKFKEENEETITPMKSFIFGGISGGFSWIFIYPQDRVKTHIQSIQGRKLTFTEGLKEILGNQKLSSLYKGFHFALLRAIPLHATAFTVMEMFKRYF